MPKSSPRRGSGLALGWLLYLLPVLWPILCLVAWFRFLLWLESLLGSGLAGCLTLVGVWMLVILGVLLALTDSDMGFDAAIVSALLLVVVLVPLTGLYAAHWLARITALLSTEDESGEGASRA
jgi:hypothetical protein